MKFITIPNMQNFLQTSNPASAHSQQVLLYILVDANGQRIQQWQTATASLLYLYLFLSPSCLPWDYKARKLVFPQIIWAFDFFPQNLNANKYPCCLASFVFPRTQFLNLWDGTCAHVTNVTHVKYWAQRKVLRSAVKCYILSLLVKQW